VVLVGAVHEARPALDVLLASSISTVALVVTAAPERRAGLSGCVDLATPARAAGVPVLPVADVNLPDVVDTIARHEPELIVVVGWTRLIRRPLLALPPRGCVGLHASLLPENRGRAPVNWAILRGEKVTGNTMMMLDPGADTGDIIDQRAIAIGLDDTCATVYERVARAGADMLRQHLPALLTGTAPRRPQFAPFGPPLPRRTPEMGVLDWSWSAAQVHDWVRALTSPYPGAFTALAGRRVMVWRTRPPTGAAAGSEEPGTVLAFEDESGIRVATGGGSVVVVALGDPGGPARSAVAWCCAAGVGVGARFDPVPPEIAAWARGLGPQPAGVGR
jgi:methionyl-tRNA formyltransferase